MGFDPNMVSEVKRANPIEEVIGQYTALKPRSPGSPILRGICPFHEDRDPSLTVWTTSQTFCCFVCDPSGKEGSDVISFVMRAESLTFPEAVEFLAKRAGIMVNDEVKINPAYDRQLKRCQRYISQLKGSPALKYLLERGLTYETITNFKLGYCKGDVNDPWEDRSLLKNRIVFPIEDVSGKVISFAGRVIDSGDDREKYVNEPNSDIFCKGKTLYHLSRAKRHIQNKDFVVVVEGYIDALMMYNYGVHNVVSIMSTALTESHLEILKKYTNNIILLLDGDKAGMIATLRHIEEAKKQGMNVLVAPLADGMDPDELARELGSSEAIYNWIESNAVPAETYQVGLIMSKAWGKILVIQSEALKEIIPIIAEVKSDFMKQTLVDEVASKLKVSTFAVEQEVTRYMEVNQLGKSKA